MMSLISSKMTIRLFGSAILVLLIVGCTSHVPYRTQAVSPPCYAPKDDFEKCKNADIEKGENGYILGFAEFDDQGAFWNRDQTLDKENGVLKRLMEGTEGKDILMVVFVHGWQNNAEYKNGNVQTFRAILTQLQKDEIEKNDPENSRRVVGMYVGWRGLSLDGVVLTQLTFFDRKNTSEKVGHGAVTDLLRHIELLRSTRMKEHQNDRLVIVGHSFGGAIVHTALNQIISDRLVEAKWDPENPEVLDPRPFGDLVLLINPAFEAQRYETLYEMDKAPHPAYKQQLPILAILTSESDWATKFAFPIGRWFSTFWEYHKNDDEKTRNRQTIGHYAPYKTHRLFVTSPQEAASPTGAPSVAELGEMISSVQQGWEQRSADTKCGWEQKYGQTTLKHFCDHSDVPVNSPYLVIEVDEAIIADHNDIANPYLVQFVREFVLSSLR